MYKLSARLLDLIDAAYLDSTKLTADEVVERMMRAINPEGP